MCYLIYNGVEFSQACFAISNIPEERIKILKSETELNIALMFSNETMLIVISIDQIKCFAMGTIKC